MIPFCLQKEIVIVRIFMKENFFAWRRWDIPIMVMLLGLWAGFGAGGAGEAATAVFERRIIRKRSRICADDRALIVLILYLAFPSLC